MIRTVEELRHGFAAARTRDDGASPRPREPKVSALLRGRLSGFSTDRLLKFLTALGQDVDIVIRGRRASGGRGRLNVVAASPPR